MSKTQKSAQDSSKSASSNSQVSLFPTAKSPSLTTATDSIDARNVPTAHSRSTKTGIGANTSDFERPVGMSDTSAGSSQQNSKIEPSTALSATSPQLLLNDLRRGQLFGKQSQSQSQQTNNNQTVSTTTFTSTTFTSTASEPSESEDSFIEKQTQPEKSTRTPRSQSRILSVLEKKREKNNNKSKKSLKSKSKKILKSKMNGSESSKKAKKNRVKTNDDSSKRVPTVRSMVPTNSSCSDAATSHSSLSSTKSKKRGEEKVLASSKEFPEIAGVSLSSKRTTRKKNQNVDESVRMVNYAPLNNGLTDISKKPPSSVVYPSAQTIQSQRYPLVPGQSPSLTSLAARQPVQENFAPGPISKQSVRYPIQQQPQKPLAGKPVEQKTLRSASRGAKKEHHFPGTGRSLKTMAAPQTEIKPVGDGSLKEHCVYDISNLNNSQRRLPPKAAQPKSLFGSARSSQPPQKSKPSDSNTANKVVIYGTTADGKNQVEFTVQMRIVAGEVVGANQNQPVDVLPKKVIVGGKEISVEKNRNESMNL